MSIEKNEGSTEKVRISRELYDKLKEISEKTGKSIRELVDHAITLYIMGNVGGETREIKSITNKFITLQYNDKCDKCGKDLKQGELAYWVKIQYNDNTARSYVYCLDCYYSENGLAEYYLRKKKLEAIIKGLDKKANELVKEVDFIDKLRELRDIENEIKYNWNTLLDIVGNGETQKLNEILDLLTNILERVMKLEKELTYSKYYVKAKERKQKITTMLK